jgi:hypothetical protein
MKRETTQFEWAYAASVNKFGVLLLAIHVPVLCAVAHYCEKGVLLTAALGALLLSGPAVLVLLKAQSSAASVALAIAAMGFSALLIHTTGGMIEAHFHIFTMLALLIVFGRITPLIAAGTTIALHHVLFWLWLPASVFNYKASFGIVALHAFFVVFELVPACWIAWQFGNNLWASGIVNERLSSATEQIGSASALLRAASEELAEGASRQASTLEETSGSSVQIRTSARDNAQLAADALALIESVNGQMSRVNVNLDHVKASVIAMANSSHEISKVIKLIDEIAFQTSILSLNASIEAARAGEFGQGFSVVADEVRGLARRSAAAATDTATLVEGAVDTSKTGQSSLLELVSAMSKVTETASLAKQHIEKIQAASRQQTEAADQISDSLGQLGQISQSTAASAEETAASGVELSQQTSTLREIVTLLQEIR